MSGDLSVIGSKPKRGKTAMLAVAAASVGVIASHTPGPWRWEVNLSSKVVELCGGKPQYDLTVMDFKRWGTGGAIPRFCDTSDRGLLTRCLKWACKVIGREHHARWFQSLDHPDARLIAAAPELLEALEQCVEKLWATDKATVDKARAVIAKARGQEVAA